MATIDSIDKRIIDLLIEDGRMSSADIARAIGKISERSVRYRLDRLIEQGIIRISAVINPSRLGLQVVADVHIVVEPGLVIDVAQKLASYEMVSYVACSTGDTDISVKIYARDNVELYTFVADVIGKIGGVRKTTTSLTPIIMKDLHNWRIPASLLIDA